MVSDTIDSLDIPHTCVIVFGPITHLGKGYNITPKHKEFLPSTYYILFVVSPLRQQLYKLLRLSRCTADIASPWRMVKTYDAEGMGEDSEVKLPSPGGPVSN